MNLVINVHTLASSFKFEMPVTSVFNVEEEVTALSERDDHSAEVDLGFDFVAILACAALSA